jgi:hypothetical protein
VRLFVRHAEKELGVKQLDDWYNVSATDIAKQPGGKGGQGAPFCLFIVVFVNFVCLS